MWKYKTPGIPDEEFERAESVPITKEEVRAVQISKARLNEDHTIYDIGCGSGSVSVEAALQASRGKVYAVDSDPAAINLTKKNLAKFGVGNVTVTLGDARDVIGDLPQADAVFVGGTGGATRRIIELCGPKIKKGGRIIIGVILIETMYDALGALTESGFESVDLTQVTISKGRRTKTGTMMLARNPVTVISATRDA